jgi:hypothetical protein
MSLAKLEQLSEIPNLSKELLLAEKLRKECEFYDTAKEYLSCDFERGLITRIKGDKCPKNKIGDVVGGINISNGYISFSFQDKKFKAHRFIFYCFHGYLTEQIDHENQIRDDNRILNLRGATLVENRQNRSINKNNKCGHQGVYLRKDINKWVASININGKQKHLGCFNTLDEAIQCRKAAELIYYPHKYQGN